MHGCLSMTLLLCKRGEVHRKNPLLLLEYHGKHIDRTCNRITIFLQKFPETDIEKKAASSQLENMYLLYILGEKYMRFKNMLTNGTENHITKHEQLSNEIFPNIQFFFVLLVDFFVISFATTWALMMHHHISVQI